MTVTDELLANAEHTPELRQGRAAAPPQQGGDRGVHGRPPNPYGLLGLSEGDAHVIRNAGGVITDDDIRCLRSPSACSERRRSS